MKNTITKEKIEKSYSITKKALEIAENNIKKKEEGKKIVEMAKAYLEDSKYFLKKGDLINSFGALYYAHGWIDCGVKLEIFKVNDEKLFTLP